MAITAEERAHRKHVKTTKPCDRCGTPRVVNGSRDAGICKDCRYVEPLWPYALRYEVPA